MRTLLQLIYFAIFYRRTILIKSIVEWVTAIKDRIKLEIQYRKRLKEMQKKDPHIYK